MSEKDNLQEADGTEKKAAEETTTVTAEADVEANDASQSPETPLEKIEAEVQLEKVESTEEVKAEEDSTDDLEEVETESTKETETTETPSSEEDEVISEIEESNAKDAETDEAEDALASIIEEKDYTSMSMEDLVVELEGLLKSQEVQKIKSHVEGIRRAFGAKFSALLEEQKKAFLEQGGNSIDFRFDYPSKKQFNTLYRDYRDKRQSYYQNLQETLKNNLSNRLEIIEEIKGLLNVEENINTTYKQFKALQERWRNAGPIPRDKYNNVWNNYHHHVENFYDFLHLNRDLRDLDFKHNLDKKVKIIERAEELAKDDDSMRAFRELQALHKLWKEELGPVAKEHREEIWERFRNATKAIHEKRQAYFGQLDEVYKKNLEVKNAIIQQISDQTAEAAANHSAWQKKIKIIEDLRKQFFSAGKVPIKVNEATWAKFKEAVREFNRKKNAFYKDLKKEQFNNLQKKLELIKIAEDNKDSTDFETTTPLMKKIQSDWKKIGHVPRKDSDKIWNQFKSACNHYFDKFHEQQNVENEEENAAFEKKNEMLAKMKDVKLGKDQDANLEIINNLIGEWKEIGQVGRKKRFIEGKFGKAIDALYGKLDVSKEEAELLKYDNKLATMNLGDDKRLLDNEHNFIRKKIDEIEGEINQLENNLQFFSNVEEDNPMLKDVLSKIENQKSALSVWRSKLNKVKKYYS